jgi:HAD superfamily hydrolase (TIGR01548 family)
MAGAQFDSVIFDMDEVLVNTTQSYLKAIEITANQMLGADRVGKEDVRRIKLCRWFNDDIDCAYRLVALAKAGKLKSAARAKIVSEQERKSKDYKEAEKIFQTAYLGKKYSGLIKNETPLVSRKTLGKLRAAGLKMGIATGRPRKEAEFAIRKNGWEGIFSAVVCVDDCARKKPCPDPLLLAKKKLGALNPVYVGDNEADKQAAASAGIPFASVGRAKGKWNLAKTDDILKLVVK